jgi:LysM repeat protein
MSSRRDFFRRTLWFSLGTWAGANALWAAAASRGTYIVKPGDTLSEIAEKHGVTVYALKRSNRLSSDLIRVGQKLTIPGTADPTVLAPVIAATRRIDVDTNRWRYIVAHHSAVEAGNAKTYGAEHGRRGYEHGLAYHFVIGNGRDSGDGEIEIGPRWIHQLRGGHVRDEEVNNTGVGICLIGNLENHPPTARQLVAFTSLVDWLRAGQVSPRARFTVHRWVDRNHTVCPGRHFPFEGMKRRYA